MAFIFPDLVKLQISDFQTLYTTTLHAARGVLSNLSNFDRVSLGNRAQNIIDQLLPYANGTDVSAASQSIQVINHLNVIKDVLVNGNNAYLLVSEQDPNLFKLAARYYGDVSLWKALADANDMTDPYQVGFFELKIPLTKPILTPKNLLS